MHMEFLPSIILSLVRKKANRLTIEILYGNYCDRNIHSTNGTQKEAPTLEQGCLVQGSGEKGKGRERVGGPNNEELARERRVITFMLIV